MKRFYLDIETGINPKLVDIAISRIKAPGNYKDPEKIAAYIEEKKADLVKVMSVDIDMCVIKCIGLKIDDQPAKIVSLEELLFEFSEQLKVRAEMAQEFARRKFFEVITFNGKAFDLPIIIRECIRQKINTPLLRDLYSWTKKYDNNVSIDLMEVLGNGNYKKLDDYSKIYLDWPKKECDFLTVSQEELEAHCVDDVEMTAALYHVFEYMLATPMEDARRVPETLIQPSNPDDLNITFPDKMIPGNIVNTPNNIDHKQTL